MCKKKQFKYCPSKIDECLRIFIDSLDAHLEDHVKIVACCCGHTKYPMTIICKFISGDYKDRVFDLVSDVWIPRKRKFYKKDKQGYYYIPETQTKETKEKKE